MAFIRFPSHRQRERGLSVINDPTRRGQCSMDVNTSYGIYWATAPERDRLRAADVKFSTLSEAFEVKAKLYDCFPSMGPKKGEW